MGFSIVGSSLNSSATARVLQRQNFNKEPNGLETIIEAYAIKTENRDLIVPEKDTLHSTFHSTSPASFKKYSRMVVESVTTEEQDGGITQMLVTFVGLTASTGLPPPIVRLIPTAGEGVYGPPLVIEAEYVTDVSETEFMAGQLSRNNGTLRSGIFSPTIKMPAVINGTTMPVDPRTAFYNAPKGGFGGGAIVKYSGYCVLSMSCDRRGLFLIARNTYHEVQQIAIITQGAFS
jgi:hypothetical protein